MPHESWLEAGTAYPENGDCPYCGQALNDRTLVDGYKNFFSVNYKQLSESVRKSRQIFAKYETGEFRKAIIELDTQNQCQYEYWKVAANLKSPNIENMLEVVEHMEQASRQIDRLFQEKQANLTESVSSEELIIAISAWNDGCFEIERINKAITNYQEQIKVIKDGLDSSLLPTLEEELNYLRLSKRRYEADVVKAVEQLRGGNEKKGEIDVRKKALREALTEQARSITATLGVTINSYLKRLNAGFRIDYKEPNYRGKEPAASYQILINDVPVSPNAATDNVGQPSFRNTLSTGDKSTLALALFLARIYADSNISKTIVVLDDPFTSMDNFRRQFTAIEIRKLCQNAKQTIVLSHDKGFLRLLWDKVDQSIIKCIALQTGAPGVTTIAPLNIKEATQPRYITERMKIEEFIEGEIHEQSYIRTRLRTVCEDFYRKGDPGLFGEAANLEEIIRKLESAPDDYPYKGAYDDLRIINEYSRCDNHAEIQDNPSEETSNEELKGFCQIVLNLTRGM